LRFPASFKVGSLNSPDFDSLSLSIKHRYLRVLINIRSSNRRSLFTITADQILYLAQSWNWKHWKEVALHSAIK